jgi:pimeloyl-ACP methyl ester carboxylesterase
MLFDTLRSKAAEATAYARQAFLLARDLDAALPAGVTAGDVVFFLHGFLATAGVLRPLRDHVARLGRVHAASLTYPPGPGIAALSSRLEAVLAPLRSDARLHLVGHSLGGIVARHYAVTRRDERLVSTIALASPFGGVKGAGLLPLSRDLDPESAALALARTAPCTVGAPHLSIFAGADGLTRDRVAHAPTGGEVVVVEGLGHNALLYDRAAMDLVVRRILELRATRVG